MRRGITATSIKKNYNGKKEFLIDAGVFPGSSGSPIFICNQGTFNTPNGEMMGSRLYFIGIVYMLYTHLANGKIIPREIPIKTELVTESYIPNNLGIVIKSIMMYDFEPIIKSRL